MEQSALPGDDSGALKNALDWLRLLGDRDPPYLHDKVIGLISTAGGTQGCAIESLQALMNHSRVDTT